MTSAILTHDLGDFDPWPRRRYVRPQENGNKLETRWMALDGSGGGVVIAALGEPLSMACHHYDEEDFDTLPQAALSANFTHDLGEFYP